jgi:hypothetical protein
MRFPQQDTGLYAPMQRSRESDYEQNRKFRRKANHMSEGQRRIEMRRMATEIGTFGLKRNDWAIMSDLIEQYRPYFRVKNPKSEGIKAAHAKMGKWYDEVRADYLAAHQEDMEEQIKQQENG